MSCHAQFLFRRANVLRAQVLHAASKASRGCGHACMKSLTPIGCRRVADEQIVIPIDLWRWACGRIVAVWFRVWVVVPSREEFAGAYRALRVRKQRMCACLRYELHAYRLQADRPICLQEITRFAIDQCGRPCIVDELVLSEACDALNLLRGSARGSEVPAMEDELSYTTKTKLHP